jgi:hypothetical protein
MARIRAHEQVREALEEARVESALAALVPLTDTGGPAWADVLERASALPPCTCHQQALDSQTSMPQEATWPLPIRNRRTT